VTILSIEIIFNPQNFQLTLMLLIWYNKIAIEKLLERISVLKEHSG